MLSKQTQVALPEGYRWFIPTLDDHTMVEDIANAHTIANYGKAEIEAGNVRIGWQSPNFNIAESVRVVMDATNNPVGYVSVWDNEENPPVIPYVKLRLHPDHEDEALAAAMLAWGETRARQAIDRCPDDARVALQTAIKADHPFYDRVYSAHGQQVVRHFYTMMIERPQTPAEPQLPDGISIRPMRYPDEFEKVVLADKDSFQDHYGYVDMPIEDLMPLWTHWVKTDPHFDPNLWFVAVDDATGEFAGVCLSTPIWHNDSTVGYVDTLGVTRAYRRKGLGMALLQHSFKALWALDKQKITLGVDASSITGATRLYERAGMHVYRKVAIYEKTLRDGKDYFRT